MTLHGLPLLHNPQDISEFRFRAMNEDFDIEFSITNDECSVIFDVEYLREFATISEIILER